MKKPSVFVVVLFVLVGCKSSQGPSVSDVVGVYAVETFDGAPLPQSSAQGTVQADSARMNSNLSYTQATWYQPPGGASRFSVADTGTWTLDGSAVHFVSKTGSGSFTGQWSGGRMLVVTQVHTNVYRKVSG